MEQKRIKLIITFLFGLGMFALQAQEQFRYQVAILPEAEAR